MKERPFLRKSIEKLEELFSLNSNDPEICRLLWHELTIRSTNRAKKLRERLLLEIQSRADGTPEAFIGRQQPPQQIEAQPTHFNDEVSPETASFNGLFVPIHFEEAKPEQQTSQVSECSEPEAIIKAWTALEVLSPTPFNKPKDLVADPERIVAMSGDRLPWTDGKKYYRPNKRLYYQIILGSIKMQPATDALLDVYGDSRVQRPQTKGYSVLASVLVDDKGCLAGADSISLSSFGWGLPLALKGDLESLHLWPEAEKQIIHGLMKQFEESADVRNQDGDNGKKTSSLTMNGIMIAFHWLIKTFGLSLELVEPPFFAVCTYQNIYSTDTPDTILLNSFFLKDLNWARFLYRAGKLPEILKRYLGMVSPEKRLNLLESPAALRNVLKPSNFPGASWPGKGRHPLVLLQQCAVNAAMNNLKDGEILAVNGPPGTGKTTLLRDIVAAIITERAKIMATYNDPDEAFRHSGQRIRRGNGVFNLFWLDEKLRGYEMLVASSNNKAVENISAELPGRDAVADDSLEQGYFSTVSNALWPNNNTWGVISAVLGKSDNRNRFRSSFWWDIEKGLHWYLKHVCGSPHFITGQDGQQIVPPVILNENPPPNHREALQNWVKARKYFQKVSADVERRLDELQGIHDLYDECLNLHETVVKLQAESEEIGVRLQPLEVEALSAAEEAEVKRAGFEKTLKDRQSVLESRPGLIRRILFRSGYSAWKMQLDEADANLNSCRSSYEEAQSRSDRIQQEREALLMRKHENRADLKNQTDKLEQRKNEYSKLGKEFSQTRIDGAFFDKSHEGCQKTAPWFDEETARLRGDLFEAAIQLHKAFIDGAARPIRHNCRIFIEDFCMKSLGTPDRDALAPHLWSTFFLIVPVVSTTFASVGGMLSGLGKESLGWLLVDEAGQALPQASVGALARCRRAVVVGDPLQIEPIVTLPEVLTEKICEQFKIDANNFNAPVASVQTLADRASKYIGAFEVNNGCREVGVPLLVHRRCSEPMFSISNTVAYENLMVQAKHTGPSRLVDALGPSRWIDVKGAGTTKWCSEEGEEALQLLQRAKNSGCQADIYLVTPFVDVQDNMRILVRQSHVLYGWVEDPKSWIYERIGTVHTVQGREAEGVIFILGAPDLNQSGARAWAGKSPNLLNVAVTRAKEALYVIGNRDHWKHAGVFKTLSRVIDTNFSLQGTLKAE
ncbi:MAG: DEAD/DEAH box helicase [Aminivibrio sp.]